MLWKMLALKVPVLEQIGTKNGNTENVNTGTEDVGFVKLWYRKIPIPENFGTGNSDTEHACTGIRNTYTEKVSTTKRQ